MEDKEKLKATRRAYYLAHKEIWQSEQAKARRREYYQTHREQRREAHKKWEQEHREERKEYIKEYYWANRERLTRRSRLYQQRCKEQVFRFYSQGEPTCAICSESRIDCLSIDHIYNDGARHRREIGGSGVHLYRWLIRNNYPKGFQVLCMNCQFIKKASKVKDRWR